MDLKIQYLRNRSVMAEFSESFSGTLDDAAALAARNLAWNEASMARILDATTEEELHAAIRGA